MIPTIGPLGGVCNIGQAGSPLIYPTYPINIPYSSTIIWYIGSVKERTGQYIGHTVKGTLQGKGPKDAKDKIYQQEGSLDFKLKN